MNDDVNELGREARAGLKLIKRKLKNAREAANNIIDRIESLDGLENGTDEDCAYIAEQFKILETSLGIAQPATIRAHVLLDVARDALGLSEGGNKCSPWGDC